MRKGVLRGRRNADRENRLVARIETRGAIPLGAVMQRCAVAVDSRIEGGKPILIVGYFKSGATFSS
jgi:hypothetical protein